MTEKRKNQNPAYIIVTGLTGAITSSFITAPIDRLKFLIQNQDVSIQLKDKKYKGYFDCIKRWYKEQGFLSFYRGNLMHIIRKPVSIMTGFASKDFIKQLFSPFQDPKKQSSLSFFCFNIISGGLAGAIGLFAWQPLDYLRFRLLMDVGKEETRQFKNARDLMRKTYANDGIQGFYRGYFTWMWGIVAYRALYFGIYDTFKGYSRDIYFKFLIAQSTVMAAATLTYPFDTIRTRLMMQSWREKKLYTGISDCVSTTFKNEGIRGFYKGYMIKMFTGIGGAIVLVVYDNYSKNP